MMIRSLACLILLLGATSGCLKQVEIESALATSTGWNGVASRVFDGFINGQWNVGTCYHSRTKQDNSITATLKGGILGIVYPIASVKIYNRVDACCDQRLNGAKVWAGEQLCGTVEFNEKQSVYEFQCDGAEASAVSVSHSGEFLQICEIEVFVEEANLPDVPEYSNAALGQPAAQSSTGWNGEASRAVDGNTDNYYSGGSCTHTKEKSGNWWEVELPGEEYVHSVIINNRRDKCCEGRIDATQVWVLSGTEELLCGTIEFDSDVWIYHIECGLTGSKVKITNDNSYLTLCEVEVIAMEETPSEAIDEIEV